MGRTLPLWLYNILGGRRKPLDPLQLLRAGMGKKLGVLTVIHVGAHFGEERDIYEEMGVTDVLWIEASPQYYRELVTRLRIPSGASTRHVAVNAFTADTTGQTVSLRHFNNEGASNSMFAATPILRQTWPGVDETGTFEDVVTIKLDEIATQEGFEKPDLLVVDVQGAELLVLKGGLAVLARAKAVIAEVSRKPYYDGGVLYPELRDFLLAQGFKEAHRAADHGDQLYLRKG